MPIVNYFPENNPVLKMKKITNPDYSFLPLTKDTWKDFEVLFGENGACGGCWCMWWRIRRSEFNNQKGEGNKKAKKKLVNSGAATGILAYSNKIPVGWCSVAPRDEYYGLSRSRILKPIDDKKVFSIVCFFIKREFRKKGLSTSLINAAVDFVKSKNGKILEAYPVEPQKKDSPAVFLWTGTASAFLKAGFKECARRSPSRPIMRLYS